MVFDPGFADVVAHECTLTPWCFRHLWPWRRTWPMGLPQVSSGASWAWSPGLPTPRRQEDEICGHLFPLRHRRCQVGACPFGGGGMVSKGAFAGSAPSSLLLHLRLHQQFSIAAVPRELLHAHAAARIPRKGAFFLRAYAAVLQHLRHERHLQ